MSAIDVSSYQPADLSGIIAEQRPEHVVVRLYLSGEKPPQSHSLQQIESARQAGCSLGGYVWAYPDFDPAETVREGLALALRGGVRLPVLWLDLETYEGQPGPDAEWLRAAVEESRRLGYTVGVYSGMWYLQQYQPDYGRQFADLPLWLADYDGEPTLEGVDLPEGFPRAMLWGKQYSADGLDLDVFAEDVTA